MGKRVIATDKAPKAIGPYSQGVGVGNLVFFSGQIALDPETMEMVGTTVEEQTQQVMKNLTALLRSQNANWTHVVKTTIFLKSMGDFAKVNEIYGSFLAEPYPARATVEVSELPKGALVEIDAVLAIP